MSEQFGTRRAVAESRLRAERAVLLHDAAETCWEIAKILLRAAERHARQDYFGTELSVGRAGKLVDRLGSKLERILAGMGTRSSSSDRGSLDA